MLYVIISIGPTPPKAVNTIRFGSLAKYACANASDTNPLSAFRNVKPYVVYLN